MIEDAARRRRNKNRILLALSLVALLLAALVVPPLVGLSRYKVRITGLMSHSLGRPVRLASVQLRMLPRPGFVINDLTVDEDPRYGVEPVLHANTVTASIRLLPLWRGRLEIGTISVDEASLNVVRLGEGNWNLDPLFRGAARSQAAAGGKPASLPYLEATNSRVNFKNGLEKLPYSLVNADLSFWQENPGDWRLRLRAQPARTDVTLNLADTGLVRLEASLRRAPALRRMPVRVDLQWTDAQFGALARLLLGSDPGWRGALTGTLHIDGTADAAQLRARLRAEGVHRAEFTPLEPLDFDANCALLYHYTTRAAEHLACDSPLGGGRFRLTGDLPGSAPAHLSVALDRIPAQAGLDALRTLRSGLAEGLEAHGAISGQLTYAPAASAKQPAALAKSAPSRHGAKAPVPVAASPFTGGFVVEGLRLSGGPLAQPVDFPKIALNPDSGYADGSQSLALTAAVALPAGAPTPLAVSARLESHGYQVTAHGSASIDRLRQFAAAAGVADIAALGGLSGDAAVLDIAAAGSWLPAPSAAFGPASQPDTASGTVAFKNLSWRSPALPNPVALSVATLSFANGALTWDPIAFAYGPLKGTASLHVPAPCETPADCPPQLSLRFASLDAAALQAALLGAQKPGTLLSSLLARIGTAAPAAWPRLDATLEADSLLLGPVTLRGASGVFRVKPAETQIVSFDAALLDGRAHLSGSVAPGSGTAAAPAYSLSATFDKIAPEPFCQLFAARCSGSPLSGSGRVDMAGYQTADLAASATGTLHLDWRRGSLQTLGWPVAGARTTHRSSAIPQPRFDRLTVDAAIAHAAVTSTACTVQQGSRMTPLQASVPLSAQPKLTLSAASPATAKK